VRHLKRFFFLEQLAFLKLDNKQIK